MPDRGQPKLPDTCVGRGAGHRMLPPVEARALVTPARGRRALFRNPTRCEAPARQEDRMTINYNDPITFGSTGNAAGLNCTGIDFSDDGGRSWTCLPVAELDIQLPFARQDV